MILVMVQATNPIIRAGLESIVRASPTVEAIASTSAKPADVVLLEWSGSDTESLPEKLLAFGENPPPIVVLGDSEDSNWASEALQAGAAGILPRSATESEILAAIAAAEAGLVVLHPDTIDSLLPLNSSTTRARPADSFPPLTPREVEVLDMLAEGLGNKAIAKRLNISDHTVKFHVSSIFTKLNASSRTEAVTLGARLGLIML